MDTVCGICSPSSCERVATNWRAIPAVLVLAASIVMFVAMLFAKKYLLLIPPGVGILGSLYNIYIGCEFAALKTHSELNDDHRNNNVTQAGENEKLRAVRDDLATQVATLQAEKRERDEQIVQLRANVTQFSDQIAALREENTKLSATRNQIDANSAASEARLLQLHQAIETQGGTCIEQFRTILQGVTIEMRAMQAQNALLKGSSDATAQFMDSLTAVSSTLETYLSRDRDAASLITMMTAAQKEQRKVANATAKQVAKLEVLLPVVATLQKTVDSFSQNLGTMHAENAQLAATRSDLADTGNDMRVQMQTFGAQLQAISARIQGAMAPPTPSGAAGGSFDFSQEGQPGAAALVTPPRGLSLGRVPGTNIHGFRGTLPAHALTSPPQVHGAAAGVMVLTTEGKRAERHSAAAAAAAFSPPPAGTPGKPAPAHLTAAELRAIHALTFDSANTTAGQPRQPAAAAGGAAAPTSGPKPAPALAAKSPSAPAARGPLQNAAPPTAATDPLRQQLNFD